jgi:hypothetical protein
VERIDAPGPPGAGEASGNPNPWVAWIEGLEVHLLRREAEALLEAK